MVARLGRRRDGEWGARCGWGPCCLGWPICTTACTALSSKELAPKRLCFRCDAILPML